MRLMTTMKYNFSTMFAEQNPLYGIIVEVNNASSGIMIYCMLLIIYIVSAYIMIRRTQDIGKSLLSSTHILMVVSLILFYAGKVGGNVLISDVVMLGIIVIEIIGISALYFNRMKGS